jgi:SurA N-terminal domain
MRKVGMRRHGVRRRGAVLRRLVTTSAVVLGAGLVLAGCAPVKFGAAAIVGDQAITIATLDTDATNLSQSAQPYKSIFQLTPAEVTQDTLTWLIQYQITEQLARQSGIEVSAAQAQAALQNAYNQAKASAASQGVANASLDLILAHSGIPPVLSAEVGRYLAIDGLYETKANGGVPPTSSSAAAVGAKLQHAECLAAKALKIQVNPQFGRLDYSSYQVVPAASTVTRAEGPAKAASLAGLAPAC